MKITSFTRAALLVSALFLAAPLHAAGDAPTPYPAPSDEAAWPGVGPIRVGSWMTDQRAYFWTLRAGGQQAVVFVGDSLIGGWKNLRAAFPGINVANRGVGGDVSRGVLFRFQEDVLDLHPRAIILCVGSNDLSAHANTHDTIANISTMVELAREADSKLPIVLCTIPPRNVPNAPIVLGSLGALNDQLKTFAQDKPNVMVLDLFTAFANPDGTPDPEYIGKDGIHITAAGFERWADMLRPILGSLDIVATPPPSR